MTMLDKRLNAFRPDLADDRLRGQVEAERFVSARPAGIGVPVADMRDIPSLGAGLSTQILLGENVCVFEEKAGWAWIQCERDSYVGYVRAADLRPRGSVATHKVSVPRTFVYPTANLKAPHCGVLSIATELVITGQADINGTSYALLPSGQAVIARHLMPVGDYEDDYVTVAETLIGTPYLWGGTSSFGVDCSGLVQLAMRMSGHSAPRDSDMQASMPGEILQPTVDHRDLRRGDLVFWKGHVAIVCGDGDIVHANGYTMSVSRESLFTAIDRIAVFFGRPTMFKRPAGEWSFAVS